MVSSNTEGFSKETQKAARFAKALGHPARIAIILHLLKHEKCVCNDLVDSLPLAQSTISQHLKALKEAGLIKGNIESPHIRYCLNTDNWNLNLLTLLDVLKPVDPDKTNPC